MQGWYLNLTLVKYKQEIQLGSKYFKYIILFCTICLNLPPKKIGSVSQLLHLNHIMICLIGLASELLSRKLPGLQTMSHHRLLLHPLSIPLCTLRLAHTLIEWELCKEATEPPEKACKCAPGTYQTKPPRN